MNLILPENFTVTAHTGCLGTSPNTVDSMANGVAAGANIVEFDLNFNDGSEPVLSHDSPSSNAVHLKEAFKFLSKYKNIKANVDVKDTSHLEKVSQIAAEYGVTEQIFFTGIFEKDVPAVKKLCPQIPYYLNFSVILSKKKNISYISDIVETVKRNGAIGINIHYKGASKQLVKAFHNEGLLVSLWTVNSRYQFCKTVKLCPDNITTKRPDRLCWLL